jgi:predicted transcriptional regulator
VVTVAPPTPERDAKWFRLYHDEGRTLQEIGDEFGVTRERVRQVLREERERRGVTETTEETRRRHREEALDAIVDARRGDIMRALREDGSAVRAAERLRLPRAAVKRVLGSLPREEQRALTFRLRGERQRASAATDAMLLEYIRQAAGLAGEPLTREMYDRVARRRGWPTCQTPMLRFGTWLTALEAAGVEGVPSVRGDNYERVSLDVCLGAVAWVRDHLGHWPSVDEYDRVRRWALAGPSPPPLPSLATVRNRARLELGGGGWYAVIGAAKARGRPS